MQRTVCETCGGLVVEKDGKLPPLTGFGFVQCWCCYDGKSERVEPPPERYVTGRARCKVCGQKLPEGRRCGRCPHCQRRRQNRRQYMRAYRNRHKAGVP